MNLIFPSITAIIFFGLGVAVKNTWIKKNCAINEETSSSVVLPIDAEIKNKTLPDSENTNSDSTDTFRIKKVLDDLQELENFIDENYLLRQKQLLAELGQLPYGDFKKFITANPQYLPLMKTAYKAYLDSHPEELFNFFINELGDEERRARSLDLENVMTSLMKVNPDLVLDYFESNKNKFGVLENRCYPRGIIEGLFRSNPDEALKVFSEISLKNREQLESLQSGLIHALHTSEDYLKVADNKEVMQRLGKMDSHYKKWFLKNWGEKYPIDAAIWALDNTKDNEQRQILKTVVQQCINVDVEKAAELMETYESHQGTDFKREEFLESFLDLSFNAMHSDKVMNWIEKLEDIDNQRLFNKFLNVKVKVDPIYAAKHLNKLSDESSRNQLSQKIYRRLKYINLQLAADFYANSPYKDSLKNEEIK